MSKETVGPAFPTVGAGAGDETGMTLRDYFAAKAMQGSLTNKDDVHHPELFATWCYKMADAMLKVRTE